MDFDRCSWRRSSDTHRSYGCYSTPAQSVEARSTNGMALQALHSAAASGHIGIVSMLLEAGADPNSEQVGGYTALDAADQIGDTELQAMLVAAGAER